MSSKWITYPVHYPCRMNPFPGSSFCSRQGDYFFSQIICQCWRFYLSTALFGLRSKDQTRNYGNNM
jgi:hypothetical protein